MAKMVPGYDPRKILRVSVKEPADMQESLTCRYDEATLSEYAQFVIASAMEEAARQPGSETAHVFVRNAITDAVMKACALKPLEAEGSAT